MMVPLLNVSSDCPLAFQVVVSGALGPLGLSLCESGRWTDLLSKACELLSGFFASLRRLFSTRRPAWMTRAWLACDLGPLTGALQLYHGLVGFLDSPPEGSRLLAS